jgi:hypothetical protein
LWIVTSFDSNGENGSLKVRRDFFLRRASDRFLLTKPNSSSQSSCQRRYAPTVFGIIPEMQFGFIPDLAFGFAGIPIWVSARWAASGRRKATKALPPKSQGVRRVHGIRPTELQGLPSYKRDALLEISFANQKQYLALYVLKKDVVGEFRRALPAASIGKGCIRFTQPEKIDFAVLKQLLLRNAGLKSVPC